MIKRLETLVQQASRSHLTCAQKSQLKTIDTETMMAKIAAEKRCWKLTVGAVQWCPKVTQAIARILYWKGIKKHQGGGHIRVKYLTRLAKRSSTCHKQEHLDRPKQQVLHSIQTAYKKYQWLKNDKGRWDHWLADMIMAQLEATGWPKKAIWKKLCCTERIRNNARQITMALGTNNGCHSLNQVWGPQLNNPAVRQESTSKTKLDAMCLAEAGQRCTLACHTPFLQPPLLNIFTEAIHTQAFDQVLQGTFQCPPGTDPMAQQLLATLARPLTVPIIPQWTLDKIITGWQEG